MIERFNFYDLYGYLIPGIVFLVIFWLPFGVSAEGLKIEWISAAIAVVLAYIWGHVLQSMARESFPSDQPELPSDTLLDQSDSTFIPEMKEKIIECISCDFKIDVRETSAREKDVVTRRRKDAFMLCRIYLLQSHKATYAEQFQGLYAMMRGIAAACILGAAYYAGFFFLNLDFPIIFRYATMVVAGVILFAILLIELEPAGVTQKIEIGAGKTVTVTIFRLAVLLSLTVPIATLPESPDWLKSPITPILIMLFLLFTISHCIKAYPFFAKQFAVTIYRDYCAARGIKPIPEQVNHKE